MNLKSSWKYIKLKKMKLPRKKRSRLEQIPVKTSNKLVIFFHDSKIKRKEELDIQEQAERERLAKEYIYDPSHSEESRLRLFLDRTQNRLGQSQRIKAHALRQFHSFYSSIP